MAESNRFNYPPHLMPFPTYSSFGTANFVHIWIKNASSMWTGESLDWSTVNSAHIWQAVCFERIIGRQWSKETTAMQVKAVEINRQKGDFSLQQVYLKGRISGLHELELELALIGCMRFKI